MSDKTDLVVQYRDKIRWIQKADSFALAKFLDDCAQAKEIIQMAYNITHDITVLYPKLTDKQKEVVRLGMTGMSYEEIGAELGKASSTVADAMQRAMRKMGITTKENLPLVGIELLRDALNNK